MENKRFIEETFPIKEVSEESAKEKNVRHGNISTFHIWWARKPLSASRTTIFASLAPFPKTPDKLRDYRKLLSQLAKFEKIPDEPLMERVQKEIRRANGSSPPRILDPFGGGGSIPFEALRLGCETFASDYNPVAVLLLKCTLVYPQMFGIGTKEVNFGSISQGHENPLVEEVRKWGSIILKEIESELRQFYPTDKDGFTPVCYIWSRTINCQNPACNVEIPLLPQYWLSKNGTNGIAILPVVDGTKVKFRIVGNEEVPFPPGFDPDNGNISRAVATCFVCGSVVDNKTTAKLFRQGKSSQRMIAVVLRKDGSRGKKYRTATVSDVNRYNEAEKVFQSKCRILLDEWGLSPVPDEPTPEATGPGAERAFALRAYNMTTWGDLFNSRQKLALVTLVDKVRSVYNQLQNKVIDENFSKAVTTYLAMGIDRIADFGSMLCLLNPTGGRGVVHTFGRPILQMAWTYAEGNPLNPAGAGWPTACEKNEEWIEYASKIGSGCAVVGQHSATKLPFRDNYFDAVFTDPPYYDNVPYSHLSDFFYVWLKRSIGHLYPDLFSTPLTPKGEEIVAYSNLEGGFEAGKHFFEDMLRKSFKEINRVLKSEGIVSIVYAHKSTSGWETLINSLLDSGLVVTGAWPLHTEKKSRLRSLESATLSSSIYVVARKIDREQIGFYSEVKQELRDFLNRKLDNVWREGISGADFLISGIGSAIEVFGKYGKIIDDEGNSIKANRLLEDVRRVVTNYAVKQVLHNGFAAEIKPMTRFYILWRWAYADSVLEFDDAHKLGQSIGIDVSQVWDNGFISKKKEFIEVLGPEERELDSLEGSTEPIDVLHQVLLLWKRGRYDEVTKVLSETGQGKSDVFYKVAQAISESLPYGNKEKKLLDGFLSGKERIVKEVKKQGGQTRLFE